jgi:hypothetical protein
VRVRIVPTALASLVILIVFTPASSVLSAGPDSPPILFTVVKRFEPLAWMRGGDRFSSDARIVLQDARGRHALLPSFVASSDPTVSFDGKSVLFAGKQKASDHWQIWEVTLAGGAARRLTSCADDCVRPFYLPESRFVYARKSGGRFVVEATEIAGSKTIQLTYGPGNFLPTDVLHDGRILFESSYPLGGKGTPELYTVYSDGSGEESYRCDHGKARHSGRQLSSGDIVFTSGNSLSRFTSARAQEVPLDAPVGEYAGELAETASGDWLLAWRPDTTSYFQIKRWSPSDANSSSFAQEPASNVVQPTLVTERKVPNRHPSALHDWPNANLLCLNAYTSKYKFAAESIHAVRLYTRDTTGTHAKLLGMAPVEQDGSFFVQVPTEQPLQIELLDASGKTLKREAGWFWMRRGEQRACVGCHAGPETAPENAVPMILLKSTTPANMTGVTSHTSTGGH